jgi:DNA polymerase III epsilon subunit-like protein
MKVFVYDVETTSSGRLCAIGGLVHDTTTNECIEFNHIVQIKGAMGYASKIHGISARDCRFGIPPQDAIDIIYKYTKSSDVVVVHNLSCEANCLARHLPSDADLNKFLRKGFFDTYRFARANGYKQTRLSDLHHQIFLEDHGYGDTHDPLVDAKLTHDIFYSFLQKYGESIIMRNIIVPEISRVTGVSYDYEHKHWCVQTKVNDEPHFKTFPTRVAAESYITSLQDK